MKTTFKKVFNGLRRHTNGVFVLMAFLACGTYGAEQDSPLIGNANLETDADNDQWPDNWPREKENGAWVAEEGNHFIRLTSPKPGATVMLYHEIKIPSGVQALELSWRQRVTNLKPGKQSWFDARIMMDFLDASREKVSPSPSAPYTRKNTNGWEQKSAQFLVPEGAVFLKFMPALFQVETGTWDLDDIVLQPVDAEPLRAKAGAAAAARQEKQTADAAKRRAKAAASLEKDGSLIPNGDFETEAKSKNWPDRWGKPSKDTSWLCEENNHFLRLTSSAPDKMVMLYLAYDLPEGTKALEMTWRQRVTGLKKGDMPWYDARFLFEFMDASGKRLSEKPGPSYVQKDTQGWVERSTRFLIPEEALTVIVMPALFQVKAGTLDIDNLVLKPTDPAPILAAKEDAKKIEAARYVPAEEPNRAKWPRPIKVVGNRLLDDAGKEVWLQGVNAGGLETLPQDKQAIKSTVVAIDEWKSNCVRLPMNESFWYGKSPYQKDGGEEYRKTIDQIITLAANRGAYLVLDLHRFRAPKQEHADFWKDAAARYKDHPAVLFDLFNEPHGISWEVWQKGGFVGEKKDNDESAFLSEEEKKKNQGFDSVGMQALVDAVRSTGAKNVVIAGGIFWCNDLTGITNGFALADSKGNGIMYSWHTYNWHPGWARVIPVAEKHPIFLGEVGADIHKMDFIPLNDQEDPYTFIPDMLGFIQKYRIHWTGWCFHPKATPCLLLDWNYTPSPYWGVFAKEALAGRQFEMKKMR
jgi:hypothetical protein